MAADAQATLPALIEEVRRLVTDDRRRLFEERGAAIAAAHAERRRRDVRNARYGWDASPVSVARIAAELWPLIKDADWSFSSPQGFIGGWPGRLWDMQRSYHAIGAQGGGGIGYSLPASVGAALANREHGRITININGDGDLNYAQMARAYGMHAEGPIEHPADLAPALRRGVERVKAGEPVLIDVVSQPR